MGEATGEWGIQVIAVDGKVPMAPMTANQAPKPYTWSVRGQASIGSF